MHRTAHNKKLPPTPQNPTPNSRKSHPTHTHINRQSSTTNHHHHHHHHHNTHPPTHTFLTSYSSRLLLSLVPPHLPPATFSLPFPQCPIAPNVLTSTAYRLTGECTPGPTDESTSASSSASTKSSAGSSSSGSAPGSGSSSSGSGTGSSSTADEEEKRYHEVATGSCDSHYASMGKVSPKECADQCAETPGCVRSTSSCTPPNTQPRHLYLHHE